MDETEAGTSGDATDPATSQVKRDRENCTVIVRNLPLDATESQVRQFFTDCGTVLSINLLSDQKDSVQKATVEFETSEDALYASQTKASKLFGQDTIDITIGTETTLYVANYPGEADEGYIRDLFKNYGEIIDVRFPSLTYNAHRRFCYVQFLTSKQAHDATELDGKSLPGGLKLVAKVSDPTKKTARHGPLEEGRQVFVGNLAYGSTEDQLRDFMAPHGTVESVRIPKNANGQSKSVGFVDFSTKASTSN